jgi:hypothetical protein
LVSDGTPGTKPKPVVHPLHASLLTSILPTGIVFSFLTALFWLSIYKYFPAHFAFLRRRSAYYLYGDEQTPVFTLDSESLLSIWRPLASWVRKLFGAQEKAEGVVKGVVTEVVETVTSTAVRAARTASAVMESRKLQEL